MRRAKRTTSVSDVVQLLARRSWDDDLQDDDGNSFDFTGSGFDFASAYVCARSLSWNTGIQGAEK